MAGRGGIRKGQGRKPLSEELRSTELCRSALTKKYGSLEAAIERLIQSEEPALIKFVYEHALGKPQDKVDLTTKGESINQPQEVIIKDYSKK